jgi:hypothetical protein
MCRVCVQPSTFHLNSGNGKERRPLPTFLRRVKHLFGMLFADRGHLAQRLIAQRWVEQGMQLITEPREAMYGGVCH